MEYFHEGGEDMEVDRRRAGELLDAMLDRMGPRRRVLLLPPDATRFHSGAGELTVMLYERLAGRAHVEIMPTLGTHAPMTRGDIERMFPGIPPGVFHEHSFRSRLHRLGEVPSWFVREITEGKLDFPIACEVSRLLVEGRWDAMISIGQLVPHEVAGVSNHNKNVYVGAGGRETINKTHFIGAVYGMERIMGRERSPVRQIFDYADEHLAGDLPPVTYLLTVRGRDAGDPQTPRGRLVTRGLFAGEGAACFRRGARLCRRVNVSLLARPIQRCVVWLDPAELRSTWLGNKAIYRTRMAMADGGELIVLAPGVHRFGEDPGMDRLIRRYGYRGTAETLESVARHADLAGDLSAAAHLIHGSSEGRFTIRYAAGGLTRTEIESVGFASGDLDELVRRYDPARLQEGYTSTPDGEEIFFVANPALGLWGLTEQFAD
jgi:nickel-dependent lactate racemase